MTSRSQGDPCALNEPMIPPERPVQVLWLQRWRLCFPGDSPGLSNLSLLPAARARRASVAGHGIGR